ncbi:MAG: hypothetical protein ACLQVJ_30055 [Syntrophobacteraceae bacterium]
MPRYIDMGDRIELAKGAMEFAHLYGLKPVQLYFAVLAAVAEEPEKEPKENE